MSGAPWTSGPEALWLSGPGSGSTSPESASLPLASTRLGAGPPLLLLPGLASPRDEFAQVLPQLAQRYDVLALDLPGQGASPSLPPEVLPTVTALTDAVERELDRAGLAAAHVLGVSLGGRVALELARRGRALSVVAIAPTGPVTPVERAYQVAVLALSRAGMRVVAPAADLLLRLPPLRAAVLAPLRAQGWRVPAPEAAALARSFAYSPDFWRLLGFAMAPEATIDYRSVTCPVVLAQGTHDVISLGQVLRLVTLVPGARFALLPFAGHSAVGDVPDRVLELVADAVAAARGSRPAPGARA